MVPPATIGRTTGPIPQLRHRAIRRPQLCNTLLSAAGLFNFLDAATNTYVISAGQYTVNFDIGSIGTISGASLSIGSGASVTFNSDENLANLIVNGQASFTAATQYKMTAGALNIGTGASLDIADSLVYLDNTATPFATAQGFWANGYNLNSINSQAPGIVGDWTGLGGVTSSSAIASYSVNGDFKTTLGVYDGSYAAANGIASGPGANESTGASPNLSSTQLLIRTTQTGDLNGDGKVNDYDISSIFNTLGFYNSPATTNLGTQVGDINGDHYVNDNDILILNTAGNYLAPAVTPTTGSAGSIHATAGSPFTGQVATFSSSAANSTPLNYSTSIDWGDGTSVDSTSGHDSAHAVTISGDATNGFAVSGMHTYASPSTGGHATVTVMHTPSGLHGSASVPVTVLPPLVTGTPIQATSGQEFDGVIATLNPSDPIAQESDFNVTPPTWSDGSTIPDTTQVFANGNGTFSVWDTHIFTTAGTYSAQVSAIDTATSVLGADNSSAAVTDPIAPPPPTAPDKPTGLTVSAISSTELGLVWDHIPDATSYTITRTDANNVSTPIPLSSDTANSYVDSGLDPHSSYSYTVQASNEAGDSPTSASASASTLNSRPIVQDLANQTTLHDQPLYIPISDFTGTDADANDTATLDNSSLSMPLNGGSVSIANDPDTGAPSVKYTPSPDFIGTDSFTFTVTDGIDHSQKGTVDINVTNQVPESDSFTGTLPDGSSSTTGGGSCCTTGGYSSGTGGYCSTDGLDHEFLRGSDPDTADTARFILVDPPSGVSLVDEHTGEITIAPSFDSQNHAMPVEVDYKMNDGIADGNLANARFNFSNDTVPFNTAPGHIPVVQAQTRNFANPDTAGNGLTIIEHPTHGTLTQKADGSYDYTPSASYTGQDWLTYQLNESTDGTTTDQLYHTIIFNVTPATPTITAHRTGLNTDQTVTKDVKRNGQNSDYLIMVNNGHTENHADGSADNTDTTATTSETNLARIDLSGVAASKGSMELVLSDPSAVRLMMDDGTGKLTEIQNQTVDLSAPSGPLAGLAGGGTVTVWVEGLTPSANLTMTLIYRGAHGTIAATDTVKMDVFQWDFVRKDGEVNAPITEMGLGALQNAIQDSSAAAPIDGTSAFKSRFQGLADDAIQEVRAYDSTNPSDFFVDTVSGGESSNWSALYSSGFNDMILSAGERASLRETFSLNAIDPNPNAPPEVQVRTAGGDKFVKRQEAINLSLWTDKKAGTNNTFIEDYRKWLGTNFGPNSAGKLKDKATTLCTAVTNRSTNCSRAVQWPLLTYALENHLPVVVPRDGGTTWQNTIFENNSSKSNFDANQDPVAQVNALFMSPNNVLNWGGIGNDWVHSNQHFTDETWTICADPLDKVKRGAQGTDVLPPTFSSLDAAKLANVKVGDLISTVMLDGWPPYNDDIPGHSDLITAIDDGTSGRNLDSKLYLMYSSSTTGKWVSFRDLLFPTNVDANNAHGHLYAIRSLDFAAFNTLFMK